MSRNAERNGGERNNEALSSILRTIGPGFRFIDVDMAMICPRCNMPEVLIESTSAARKATYYIRKMASACDAPTILLRHAWMDTDHELPVDVHFWESGRVGRTESPDKVLEDVSWDTFLSVLRGIHLRHACKRN